MENLNIPNYDKDYSSNVNRENFLINHEIVPYPANRLVQIPIVNSPNNEVVSFYIPDFEIDTFRSFVPESQTEGILESSQIEKELIEYIKDYLRRSYMFSVENRVKYAYENMKDLSGIVSIVLIMPDEFKEKPIIAEYLKMFKNIRKNVKDNLNTETFLSNPFAAKKQDKDVIKTKKNSENRRVLNKWGTSYGPVEKLIKLENEEYEKVKKEQLEREKEEMSTKDKGINYKQVLEKILIKNYTDFRKDILKECIVDNNLFTGTEFEMFVFYLESFITLFSGINCKYFIDELGCLNMDFYASEDIFMNMAEILHYQLQFKIMNKAEIKKYVDKKKDGAGGKSDGNVKNKPSSSAGDSKKQIKLIDSSNSQVHALEVKDEMTETLLDKSNQNYVNQSNPQSEFDEEIEKMNNIKFEEADYEDVTLFPPFANFSKLNSHFFRRYDTLDNYHMCQECRNIKTSEDLQNIKCSSLFRELDKIRIILSMLSSLINLNSIRNPPKDEWQLRGVFKFVLLIHNYQELQELTDYKELIRTYLLPVEKLEARRLNKVFKNKFGEDMGFYFFWVTHYIQWLIFPAILGLILYSLGYFLFMVTNSSLYLYFNLFFAGCVMLWANFYLSSWKSKEKFFNYIWGMDSFKLDKSNEIPDVPVDKWVFMGINMPIIKRSSYLISRALSMLIIFLSLLTTIALNLMIFYVENAQLYADSPLGGSELKMISNGYWLYITPICTYMIREWMSSIYKDVAVKLTNREYHFHKDDFNSSLKLKIIFFEFFNWYFNLYYIAFVRRHVDSCPMDDCYSMVASQLTGILISTMIVDLTKLFWNIVYQRNKTKEFENKIKEKNPNVQNASSKYIYYTRTEYEAQDCSGEYLEVVLVFGYIIQFGASSPICFFIVLLQTIFMRLMDAVKFSRIQYCKLIKESHGIGVFHKVLRLMTFLGLITNICIIFFTNTRIVTVEFSSKIFILFFVENIILLIMMTAGYKDQPFWFNFKEKIEMTYLKKYTFKLNEKDWDKEKELKEAEDKKLK